MAQNPKVDEAYALYKQGLKLIEISKELKVPEGTVRRWKCTYHWGDGERSLTKVSVRKKKENVPKEKASVRKEKLSVNKGAVVEEVMSVINNPELTEKQQLFCMYFIRSFNATRSYQKAYGSDYDVARANGFRLLKNGKIQEEIARMKQERYIRRFLSEDDIFQKYMDIAFADITDYLDFGTEEVPVMAMYGPVEIKDEDTGEKVPLKQTVNVVKFKDSSQIDGSILSEVKQGRNGASIKLEDRMKALQWLTDHMDLATEEQRARIALLKAKSQTNGDGEEQADDGFLEALNGSAKEDWKNEESSVPLPDVQQEAEADT